MPASDTRIWGDDKHRYCCICHMGFRGMGNNPDPLAGEDPEARCCDDCNDTKVIPARLNLYFGTARSHKQQAPPIGNDGDTEEGTDDAVTT